MRLLGANSVDELGPHFVSLLYGHHDPHVFVLGRMVLTSSQVNTRMLERDIYDGEPNLNKTGLWEKAALIKSKI